MDKRVGITSKTCPCCGKEFVSKTGNKKQITCSKSCSSKYFPRGKQFKKGGKVWNKGHTKHTHKIIKRVADKMIGRQLSDEWRINISLSKKGKNHPNYGKHLSEETRRKISQSNLGKKVIITPEVAQKISQRAKGKKKTDEHKKKLSESLKGKKHSPERIEAIVAGVSRSRKKKGITRPERMVLDAYGLFGLEYTGDGKYWIGLKNGKKKNPDFVKYKIAIEVFGDYWHRGEDQNELIKKYNDIGWRCLVLWEKDIISMSDAELTEKINKFINYENYEPYTHQDEESYGERYFLSEGREPRSCEELLCYLTQFA